MPKEKKTSPRKLHAELTTAAALIQSGQRERAVELLRPLAPRLDSLVGWKLLADCLEKLGRTQEAEEAIFQAHAAMPGDPAVSLRAGIIRYQRQEYEAAAQAFGSVAPKDRHDPDISSHYAHALLAIGREQAAHAQASHAYRLKPSGAPALMYGLTSLAQGKLVEAQQALERSSHSLDDALRDLAEGALALAHFWGGDTRQALELWRGLDRRSRLPIGFAEFLALSEASHGDEQAARAALARAFEPGGAVAMLAQARVELALGKAEQALTALNHAPACAAEIDVMVRATRGRALRMLGRADEAREILVPLGESVDGPLAAMVHVDLGRIDSDAGRHEEAAAHFQKALNLDPESPEALSGLELARSRQAWRTAAQSEINSARAEAEAIRRAFAEREREMQMLKVRLAQLEHTAGRAEHEAAAARAEVEKARTESAGAELAERERESADRAQEVLEQAFGPAAAKCPAPLWQALLVAENTYQTALYTELHPAAVAVLFSGALERALYLLLVRPFDAWLDESRREQFLKSAARELKPGRVEYADRFAEAFDRSRKAKAPSLGEVSRALSHRSEPSLALFGEFLQASFDAPPPLFDTLASFVDRARVQLRDPVAHGRALDLPQEELTRFRRELLMDLGGSGSGALPALVRAAR